MARSLSVDLRRRLVGAIEGGLSCRAAAQRFGVSASSAIRWRAMDRREGDLRPKRQGGDRHSQRIEAHTELILSAVAAKSHYTGGTAGWSEFELEDGSTIRLRGVLIDVKKAVDQYAQDEKPVYILQITLVNDVIVPDNLIKQQ